MPERDHSACGVGMIVNFHKKKLGRVANHRIVDDGLTVLKNFDYRSGYNLVTDESDGAGIRFYTLSTNFFQKKIDQCKFSALTGGKSTAHKLKDKHYAIGQYFLPSNAIKEKEAKKLIERNCLANGLRVAGWRNVNTDVNDHVLSKKARQKKPAIWQAILVPVETATRIDENKVRQAALNIVNDARTRGVNLNIVSQSSESIVYKGMLRPGGVASFYRDLQDKAFTASAVSVHARFATNTDPQWANAQPCPFFWSHNGELNSAQANAAQMRAQLNANNFQGIYPNNKLSDSLQFDADLANLMAMKKISLAEAFVRLMSPSKSPDDSAEVNAMLAVFCAERTPYNGPAFAVAASNGYFMAKLDDVGLRPARYTILEDVLGNRQFHAASDDYVTTTPKGWRIICKGMLEAGALLMLTPDGKLLETKQILEQISNAYQNEHTHGKYFQTISKQTFVTLAPISGITPKPSPDLNRRLFTSGWDYETVEHVVRYMAVNGTERVAAMGDDTHPLYTQGLPPHISYFFHQLFAQVSAPPLDSIKEYERFNLASTLGARLNAIKEAKQISIASPILSFEIFRAIEQTMRVRTHILDMTFSIPATAECMRIALKKLLMAAEKAAIIGGILILSDKNVSDKRATIPDMIAVAAVRKHLENKNLIRSVSILADSYQVSGPHQTAALLAVGANAIYARGVHEKLHALYPNDKSKTECYRSASEKSLLKTMGKMGITDINNYCGGKLLSALGLNFNDDENDPHDPYPTSLARIFGGFYSPLKGISLGHIAAHVGIRHTQAFDKKNDFSKLYRSGYYMPEKKGIKHGFGPEVINAFTDFLKDEEVRAVIYRLHKLLEKKGIGDFINPADFVVEKGFLDSSKKVNGFYPSTYLEKFKVSSAFKLLSDKIVAYNKKHPTSISHLFQVAENTHAGELLRLTDDPRIQLQTQEAIRKHLFSGSMSQGALTVEAHAALVTGMNAIGCLSASGEGGEDQKELRDPLTSSRSKQVASARFGVSAMQLIAAVEVEWKGAQGAKPGEGGEIPGSKITIRFAAQRGGLPGVGFISPPPHHDVYSIEDLHQIIYDIKRVNPNISVCVKLVASEGIGTIAVGVVKAGADEINIAGNSGGTGAALQSSIKHAGMPAEIGLAEVNKALQKTAYRDLVKLRTSGGFKTADDIITAAIFGADDFELGTTAMLTMGCKMQRTCNKSCQPGVAIDGHLFKGDQLNVERYFVNLAAAIQEKLVLLGVKNIRDIRGRTELLSLINPELEKLYDFSAILDRSHLPPALSKEQIAQAFEKRKKLFCNPKEDALVKEIKHFFEENPTGIFIAKKIVLTTADRSFGARIAGEFVKHLEANRTAKIILNTEGVAGQSFGFVTPPNMTLNHHGHVQDGCGKSMTGGELIIRTPHKQVAGNAAFYGIYGGKVFIQGSVGHRFGIVMKGGQIVLDGDAGDFACEYMTSGTVMFLGALGKGLCTGASGGIVFVYDADNKLKYLTDAVRVATEEECKPYLTVIEKMLCEHIQKTGSEKAKKIVINFKNASRHFKILIPKEMDNIKTLRNVIDVIKTYQLRGMPLTPGMQVWFEQKILMIF